MYVYIVQDGEYSQKCIVSVHSSLGLAMDSLRPNSKRTWRTWNPDPDWWMSDTDSYEIFRYEVDKVEV